MEAPCPGKAKAGLRDRQCSHTNLKWKSFARIVMVEGFSLVKKNSHAAREHTDFPFNDWFQSPNGIQLSFVRVCNPVHCRGVDIVRA